MPSLESQIRNAARAHGFDLCGFARVQPIPHAESVTRWVESGMAAAMDYLGRGLPKRLDPRLVLPDAASVISLGYRYQPPRLPDGDWRAALRGRIAAYALGTDYHRLIEKKLQQLAARLTELRPAASFRWYVDTGPVLEREWAALAGLGWFGKNTNILRRDEGSWFFLAELLTDLVLEPDPPSADHCGTCVSCLDRCPTGALAPDYQLDARLCISYWTIEHRGWVPRELRARFDNWVFGCDVCQDVCPWNEKLARQTDLATHDELFPSLIELARLDEETFRQRYRGTPVLRTKREGLVRNAVIALGNSASDSALAPLVGALENDPSPIVRGHAAGALANLQLRPVVATLDQAILREPDPEARSEIQLARQSLAGEP